MDYKVTNFKEAIMSEGKDEKVGDKRISTEEGAGEIIRKLFRDNLELTGNKEVVDACIKLLLHGINHRYGEAVPLVKFIARKDPELFCPWDGQLHRDPECDRASDAFDREEAEMEKQLFPLDED